MAIGPVCEAFLLAAELANARNLPETWAPGALASYNVDDDWRLTINRSGDEQGSIPGFSMAVEHKGWPVGMLNPRDGVLVPGAEDRLIAALKAAIAKAPSPTLSEEEKR